MSAPTPSDSRHSDAARTEAPPSSSVVSPPVSSFRTCALPDTATDAILFPTGGAALSERGTKILDEIIACERVGEYGDHRLRIIGFTDPRGSEALNDDLGLARARAVERYLLRRGVPERRLIQATVGEQQHLGTGPESWFYDRRVEIHLERAESKSGPDRDGIGHAGQTGTPASPAHGARLK